MKKTTLFMIFLYQLVFSRILKSILGASSFCRFKPSCSEYARRTIIKHGVLRGTYLSFARLLKCKPF